MTDPHPDPHPDPRAALREAVQRLRAAGVEDAAGDARRLMEHAAGIGAGTLALHLPDRIPAAALPRFAQLVARRAARVPVAQITGQRAFYGRSFAVTGDTLDPRPDTELLVDLALAEPFARVLDLGTGTGCILLTLLAERPASHGTGCDISEAALEVARANAGALGVEARARLLRSDWFAALPAGRFDLIVANPPYIAAAEMAGLSPEVREHEPRHALTDGGDGLGAYRAIAAGAPAWLEPGGRLLLEIGHGQGTAVAALLAGAGFAGVRVHPDLAGRDRVVGARRG